MPGLQTQRAISLSHTSGADVRGRLAHMPALAKAQIAYRQDFSRIPIIY